MSSVINKPTLSRQQSSEDNAQISLNIMELTLLLKVMGFNLNYFDYETAAEFHSDDITVEIRCGKQNLVARLSAPPETCSCPATKEDTFLCQEGKATFDCPMPDLVDAKKLLNVVFRMFRQPYLPRPTTAAAEKKATSAHENPPSPVHCSPGHMPFVTFQRPPKSAVRVSDGMMREEPDSVQFLGPPQQSTIKKPLMIEKTALWSTFELLADTAEKNTKDIKAQSGTDAFGYKKVIEGRASAAPITSASEVINASKGAIKRTSLASMNNIKAKEEIPKKKIVHPKGNNTKKLLGAQIKTVAGRSPVLGK